MQCSTCINAPEGCQHGTHTIEKSPKLSAGFTSQRHSASARACCSTRRHAARSSLCFSSDGGGAERTHTAATLLLLTFVMLRPSALRVTPLSRFGAEIAGISLRSSLASEPVAAQVRHALDEHGLLLFRGQSDLKAEHLVGLGSWFGTVFPLPPRFQHPVCHRGLEPQNSRPQRGLLLTHLRLALDSARRTPTCCACPTPRPRDSWASVRQAGIWTDSLTPHPSASPCYTL